MLDAAPAVPVRDLGSQRLWHRVVRSRAWQVVEVPATTLDEVLGPDPVSFCARPAAGADVADALAGAARATSWREPWAVVLEPSGVSPVFLAGLAQRLPLLGLDLRTDRLLRLPGGHGELLASLMGSSWLHPLAYVLASDAALPSLAGPPAEALEAVR